MDRSVAMKSTKCLWLARQSAKAQCSAAVRIGLPAPWSTAPMQLHRGAVSIVASRTLSTKPDGRPNLSGLASEQESRESASPFKQHRQRELREDQEKEDPLYPDPYPRLESLPARKSVPEFLEDFHEGLSDENVTLTGRVRSKRVVGKSLIFLDIVNEFQKVQVMVNKNKCVSEKHRRIHKFALFKNLIQVGDHICRLPVLPLTSGLRLTLRSGHWHRHSHK